MAHKFGDNWKKAQVGNEIGEKLTSRGYVVNYEKVARMKVKKT